MGTYDGEEVGVASAWMMVSRMRFLFRNASWSCSDRLLYNGPDDADPAERSSSGGSAKIRAGRININGVINRTIILSIEER